MAPSVQSLSPMIFLIGCFPFAYNRVILRPNGTFHRALAPYDLRLVVLHTISISSVHLWYMHGGRIQFE